MILTVDRKQLFLLYIFSPVCEMHTGVFVFEVMDDIHTDEIILQKMIGWENLLIQQIRSRQP